MPTLNDVPATDVPKSSIDFLDMTNKTQTIQHVSPPAIKVENPIDYVQIVYNLWSEKGEAMAYQQGLFLGKGDKSNIQFSEFFKKLRKTIEAIVVNELKTANNTSETFKDDFKALEHVLNMLVNHLTLLQIDIKNEKTLAVLHGFINSYINSVIKSNNHG